MPAQSDEVFILCLLLSIFWKSHCFPYSEGQCQAQKKSWQKFMHILAFIHLSVEFLSTSYTPFTAHFPANFHGKPLLKSFLCLAFTTKNGLNVCILDWKGCHLWKHTGLPISWWWYPGRTLSPKQPKRKSYRSPRSYVSHVSNQF